MTGIGSNRLPDLAARIRNEHNVTLVSLRRGTEHAIAAGELLLEAKSLVQHGQWLPWLAENCAISERTAQLLHAVRKEPGGYRSKCAMRCGLTLNEAAAVLMLSSDVQKLFAIAKRLEGVTDSEEIISLCAAEGVATFTTNPFGAKNCDLEEREQLEWYGMQEYRASVEEAA
jgi:Protein of unknown function (DUF3102)